ncbi:beta-ketoacyl synthase N-terminal-like domain-containing protein [Thermoactinospora rubra]|uniref:beta-ketoacyl synthase N-terminal-like domain-containing protein n=1 Tax=Thermoactinospora rubra TaxID=1088767 RepID=UPI000A11602C|nr:beta-ketoacyl synthase N-terminal-like domain-containing protein [Thermoactinospora rubra]
MSRRAVITGLGVVAPTGIGVVEHWENSLSGRPGIGPIASFDAGGSPIRWAGQVPDFDEKAFVDGKLLVQTDRWTWFAFAAAQLALADAALDPSLADPFELSVVTASASGGNAFGQREIQALWSQGSRAVSAYQSIGWFYAASSGQLSIRHQLKGACGVLVADAAGGVDALAEAARLIRRGTGAVVTGGTEAPLSPYALACQASEATVSRDGRYRPFSPDAAGYVPGEGGAILVVEERERALERGAPTVYAEIAGTSSTHDAHHVTDPAPGHRQYARAMREAVARAGLTPADIGVVFADGAGDPVRDRQEAAAIEEVFGPGRVPVTVPKTMTGRLYSGGAALDLAWAALALADGVLPPTVGVEGDVPGLDLVRQARTVDGLSAALVLARGAGGFNSAAVLTKV